AAPARPPASRRPGRARRRARRGTATGTAAAARRSAGSGASPSRLPGYSRELGADEGRGDRDLLAICGRVQPPARAGGMGQRAGAAAPRASLRALHDPGRLPEHVRALAVERREHRLRLERVTGLDAGAADTKVALERGERPVRRPPPRHAARTATNQRPAWTIS